MGTGVTKPSPTRYARIVDEIRALRPTTILEVGTWNGGRAIEMVEAARLATSPPVEIVYHGFDLFERMDERKSQEEFNVKRPCPIGEVRRRLDAWSASRLGTHFVLHPGDSTKTLPDFLVEYGPGGVDFAWIDGGHSVATIASDWMYVSQLVRRGGVILLDDYYGEMDPSFRRSFGCNTLVDRLFSRRNGNHRVTFTPERDPVRGGGTVSIVKVDVL